MVGSLRRPGPRQADRDRLPEQLQPEDRGPAGTGGAGPARDRRGLSLPPGPAGERQRDLHVGQQERRQHAGRRPGASGNTTSAPVSAGSSISGASSSARSRRPMPTCWPPSPATTTCSCCSSPRSRTPMSPSASAEAQLQVARENIALQQRSVQITEARFRGGDVGELDVLQARTQLLGTQATIPPLETGLQQAKNALSTLLGQPPGSLAEIHRSAAGRDSGGAASDCRGRPDGSAPAASRRASGRTRRGNAKRGSGSRRGRPLSELRIERLSRCGGRRRNQHHAYRQQRLRSAFQRQLRRRSSAGRTSAGTS